MAGRWLADFDEHSAALGADDGSTAIIIPMGIPGSERMPQTILADVAMLCTPRFMLLPGRLGPLLGVFSKAVQSIGCRINLPLRRPSPALCPFFWGERGRMEGAMESQLLSSRDLGHGNGRPTVRGDLGTDRGSQLRARANERASTLLQGRGRPRGGDEQEGSCYKGFQHGQEPFLSYVDCWTRCHSLASNRSKAAYCFSPVCCAISRKKRRASGVILCVTKGCCMFQPPWRVIIIMTPFRHLGDRT